MSSARRVLVVAPHADDETIGAGGTIARHVAEGDDVHVAVVTGHGDGPHPLWPQSVWDTVRGEAAHAMAVLGVTQLHFEEIPAALVADQPVWKLNKTIGAILQKLEPEILYVPFPFDLHKDHRETFHALSVAWRTSSPTGRKIKSVYCYEVQSETHWNAPYLEAGFLPNTWSTSPRTSKLNCARSRATRANCARRPTPALSPPSARSQCGAARSRTSRRLRRSSACVS
jgi:LmbE family N-acetylglucosaminyl deacetylase